MLVLGPDSSVSPLILAAIAPLLVVDDPGKAIVLAGMLALLVGVIEIGLGLAKLGFVADLLASEVQVGYMNGLAITIVAGQLPKLFGFSTDADGFLDELRAFGDHLDQTKAGALAVGVGVLVVLLVLPRITTRIPAVLVAVGGATIASAAFDLASHGVATVGTLPQGFPKPSLPWTSLGDVGPLLLAAIGIVLVSLTDTIATASSFAARRGDELQPNQEMIGIGTANLAAGPVPGVRDLDQRIAHRGRRAVRGEVAAHRRRRRRTRRDPAALPQLAPRPTSRSRLSPAWSSQPRSRWRTSARSASTQRCDVRRCCCRSWRPSGVVALGVLQGIVVAIFLAVLLFFRRNWWPHGAVLGRTETARVGTTSTTSTVRARCPAS